MSEILRNVTMLAQLGLSFITPLLLCLALCWFITSRTGVRRLGLYSWIFSLGWADRRLWHISFYLSVNKQEKKKHKKNKYISTDIHKQRYDGQNK